ncbi:hypothetical protein Gotri_025542, partial [Gossypium trilobum]|nr:hypothetical protein [Gossypium trilobum]
MKWICYRLSRNILPFSTMTLEIRLGLLEAEHRFLRTLSQPDGITCRYVKARLKYKNGPCISWSDIRDAMGKASYYRHLALFAFSIYGLIAFPKALGYVSVGLADFLFQ